MSDSEPSLSRLIARAAERDEVAFTHLYDVTSSRVYGLAFRILADEEAAEEATLDAFSTIWRNAPRYDPQRGKPMAWILTIARSRALDVLRSRVRRRFLQTSSFPLPEAVAAGPDPGGQLEREERCAQVRKALASLPAEQRVAIETAFFAGMSHSEIADTLGQPLGTVKSRIRVGLSSLRRMLA